MKVGRTAALVLAAGLSRRAGNFKPLLPLGQKTIVDHVISTFLQSRVDVRLVVGYRQTEVRAAIDGRNTTVIHNFDYELGMFTSVQAGVRNLDPACERFFVMPVDIPLVRPATIARLLAAAEHHPHSIMYPVFSGRRGHPPLIPSSLIPSILGWGGEGGLKAALAGHQHRATEVVVPDGNILFDVDTPEDYANLLERFRRREIPTDAECGVIMNDICGVAADIRLHCAKVAEVAVNIGLALSESGQRADIEAIRAAAMMHDIAKGRPHHDAAGGEMLRDMGFALMGEVIAAHTDLAGDPGRISLEAKVVYLADKLVKGADLVTIDERYTAASRGFGSTPGVASKIASERLRALTVQRELELQIGCPLESIVTR